MYPLIATLLLTGGRPAEVYGLRVTDLDFQRDRIRFRPNAGRRIKNDTSVRGVPMWPQLRKILVDYVEGPHAPSGEYLFPSPGDHRRPLGSARKVIAVISGLLQRERPLTPKVFRHTYCSARLQTLDNGAPIAPITVSKEMGHGSSDMVNEIYGHVGDVNHRSDVVEFPLEPYVAQLRGRYERLLEAVGSDRRKVPGKRTISEATEREIIRAGLRQPELGPRKIAALLAERGIEVSASGVRWIWVRHDLATSEKRKHASEAARVPM